MNVQPLSFLEGNIERLHGKFMLILLPGLSSSAFRVPDCGMAKEK